MTTPSDPTRPTAPSVREIAELTARLRELSTRVRDADPIERAAFLADKDALIARITAAADAVPTDGEPAADHAVPLMPEWMRDQAMRAEAEMAAGSALPVRPDDPAEIASRVDVLLARAANPRAVPGTRRAAEADEVDRRAQLAAWHADDHSDDLISGDEHTICGPDPVREW